MKEVLYQHTVQDAFRLRPGVVLIVKKYRITGCLPQSKKHLVKQAREGVPGLGILLEDTVCETPGIGTKVMVPKGTYVLNGFTIEPIVQCGNFEMEMKTSGGFTSGNFCIWDEITTEIDNLIFEYKKNEPVT